MTISSRFSFLLSACAVLSVGLTGMNAHADTFGFPGQSGQSGQNGLSGANGQDLTILASGQAQSLNLMGGNGTNGTDGYNGQSASSCFQGPLVRANLYGASGGDGGDAGRGGNGGNGGNLVVYFTDVASLKNISVFNSGGAAGYSGRAGSAGAPCGCSVGQWSVPIRVCHDVTVPGPIINTPVTGGPGQHGPGPGGPGGPGHPGGPGPGPAPGPVQGPPHVETRCDMVPEQHFCQSGSYGRNGNNFGSGINGSNGLITLIQSATPLTAVSPTGAAQFGTFPQNVVLTLDKWNTVNGAQALFAPGSSISDSYRSYAGRVTVPVHFVWNTSRAQSAFVGQSISTWLDDSGKIRASLQNSSSFADISVTYDANGEATVSVNHVALATEMTQLSGDASSLSGSDTDTIVKLTDAANISDVVQTTMTATVKSDGIFDHTRFDGAVPANLIETTQSGVVVHIGQLQGIPSGDIRSGKKLKITLNVTRTLGDKSATQSFQINGKLGDN